MLDRPVSEPTLRPTTLLNLAIITALLGPFFVLFVTVRSVPKDARLIVGLLGCGFVGFACTVLPRLIYGRAMRRHARSGRERSLWFQNTPGGQSTPGIDSHEPRNP